MSGCFYLNGISFLAVIIALFLIKLNKNPSAQNNKSALSDLKQGLVFISRDRLILALISMVSAVSLFGISYVILMPVFANDILRVGVKGLGTLMFSTGLGALIGALALARLGNFKYKGKLLIWSVFSFACSLIVFSLSRNYPVAIVSLICVGCSSVTAIALINTLIQIKVPDEFRGRVMSLFMITFAGIMPFGNLISGTLAEVFGVSQALFLCGLVCLALFAVINFLFPGLRRL